MSASEEVSQNGKRDKRRRSYSGREAELFSPNCFDTDSSCTDEELSLAGGVETSGQECSGVDPGITPLVQISPDSDDESLSGLVTESVSQESPCVSKTPPPDGVFREELVQAKRLVGPPSGGKRSMSSQSEAAVRRRGLLSPPVVGKTSCMAGEGEEDDRKFPSYRLYVKGQKEEEVKSEVTSGIPTPGEADADLAGSEYVKSARSAVKKDEKQEEPKNETFPASATDDEANRTEQIELVTRTAASDVQTEKIAISSLAKCRKTREPVEARAPPVVVANQYIAQQAEGCSSSENASSSRPYFGNDYYELSRDARSKGSRDLEEAGRLRSADCQTIGAANLLTSWVNWGFSAGHRFESGFMLHPNQPNARDSVHGAEWGQPVQDWSMYHGGKADASSASCPPGLSNVTTGLHKSINNEQRRSNKARCGNRSFRSQSNSSPNVSRGPSSVIKTNTKVAVGHHHDAKKARLGDAKRLLTIPISVHVEDNGLSNDTDEKTRMRTQAWAIWHRLDGTSAEKPIPVESGIEEDGVKLAKLGKEYLRTARLGGHYSAARVRNVFAQQIETKGSCGCPEFRPNAYDEAVSRYYEQLRNSAMQ